MKLSSDQKVAVAFGLALAFLAVLGWFGYSTPRAFIALTQARQQSVRILEHLAAFVSQMKDAETGQRGYLLTGKDEYLEPYELARGEVARELGELRQLSSADADYGRRLARLDELARRKLSELQRTIDVRRGDPEHGLAAALEIVGSDEGKRLMDEIRGAAADVERAEVSRRDGAAAEANRVAGRLVWVSALVGPVSLLLVAAAGWMVLRDVAERKRFDYIEQCFHFLIESLQEYAIYLLDPNGRIVSWNAGAQRLKGYQSHEVLGKHFSMFYTPEAIAAGRPERALETARTQGRYEEEGWRVRKDGTPIWGSIVMTAIRDAEGRLQGFGKVTRDFTDRKEAEDRIRRLNAELEERVRARTAQLSESNRSLLQKNQEVETFVYSVSHDLRSPLVNLQGFSQELKLVGKELRGLLDVPGLPDQVQKRGVELVDGDMAEAIRFIQSGVTRLSNIIDALLRLSRAGRVVYQWQAVDLGPVVRRVVESQAAVIAQKGATVEVGELPEVWGDPTAVEQVFANLIVNALNYLDPQRSGQIAIGTVDDGNGPATARADAVRTVFVRDNGLGIAQEVRDRIFRAFQRLHPEAAPGEGIGLTLVSRIVERHGGRIWFESAVGSGTTFFVALPVGPESAAVRASSAKPESSSPESPAASSVELAARVPVESS